MNFGLTKSSSYEAFEKQWISGIKDAKKRAEAQNVANAISKRVPDGYLDIDSYNNKFFISRNVNNEKSVLEIGKVYYRKPRITTLLKLNNALKDLKTV